MAEPAPPQTTLIRTGYDDKEIAQAFATYIGSGWTFIGRIPARNQPQGDTENGHLLIFKK